MAVGGVFGWNLWQGRSADQDLFLALPEPVSESPTLAWSWQADTEAQAAFAVGEVTLVEHSFDTLTALDSEGEELWTSSVGPDAFVTTAPGRDDLFIEASFNRMALRSLDDGSELWASDGRLLRAGDDWLLLHEDDRIREVDLLSGRELVVGRGQQQRRRRLHRRVRRREPAPDQVVAQRRAALGRRRARDRVVGVRAGRAGRGLRRARW